jgi:glycosyltransferase involved in cell wall biosynthesis
MKTNQIPGVLPEIMFVTSFPPRECGIATYSQDLISAINNKFSNSFTIKVCALESNGTTYPYPDEVEYILKTSVAKDYEKLTTKINLNSDIKIVLIQHEFGFFQKQEKPFLRLLNEVTKPVVIVFHTVLPHPVEQLKIKVQSIASACESIIVMTQTSVDILTRDYGIQPSKIFIIAHGTHLVPHLSEKFLKEKYGLAGRRVLTTFGLLSSGKSIETTLDALPDIVALSQNVVFLVIGKTHPEVVKREGEQYREMLMEKVIKNGLQKHVIFVNSYLALPDLLEYLQLTDIYLFTSKDPNQAVSGTFVYAMSCACPIISTPIPHAKEILSKDTGILFDFCNSVQLAAGVNRLLSNDQLRKNIGSNTLQKIVATAWENSAVAHATLFGEMAGENVTILYNHPKINLHHIIQMTTDFGMLQFSKINQPDPGSGYTLDDNARALIAMCMYFKQTGDQTLVPAIEKYLEFVQYCLQPDGTFLNYVDKEKIFTSQNKTTNLDDSNGRAVWALGYLLSLNGKLSGEITHKAGAMLDHSLSRFDSIHSPRAMAFAIKGLYFSHLTSKSNSSTLLLKTLADRLVQMYRHESAPGWEWFESYLTYANSTLPEAMLCAWLLTRNPVYREIAITSFDFLLSQTFNENGIEVISNKNWLQRGETAGHFGEQAIDVAYTIMTLSKFYDVFMNEAYRIKMDVAFNWFLGNNRLHQIIYNPCTGGCYDGLEETHVNLNQGAESTLSYLMARLTLEKYADANPLLVVPSQISYTESLLVRT